MIINSLHHQEDAFYILMYTTPTYQNCTQEHASEKIHWKSVLAAGFRVQAYSNGGC